MKFVLFGFPLLNLQNEFALQQQLPDKLQKLLDTMESSPETIVNGGSPHRLVNSRQGYISPHGDGHFYWCKWYAFILPVFVFYIIAFPIDIGVIHIIFLFVLTGNRKPSFHCLLLSTYCLFCFIPKQRIFSAPTQDKK